MPRKARTKMTITDVQTITGHTNDKGIYIQGQIVLAVKVEYSKYTFSKAYRIMQTEIDKFNLNEFKERIYRESRIWIKEKDFEQEVMKKLKGTKNETVFLD